MVKMFLETDDSFRAFYLDQGEGNESRAHNDSTATPSPPSPTSFSTMRKQTEGDDDEEEVYCLRTIEEEDGENHAETVMTPTPSTAKNGHNENEPVFALNAVTSLPENAEIKDPPARGPVTRNHHAVASSASSEQTEVSTPLPRKSEIARLRKRLAALEIALEDGDDHGLTIVNEEVMNQEGISTEMMEIQTMERMHHGRERDVSQSFSGISQYSTAGPSSKVPTDEPVPSMTGLKKKPSISISLSVSAFKRVSVLPEKIVILRNDMSESNRKKEEERLKRKKRRQKKEIKFYRLIKRQSILTGSMAFFGFTTLTASAVYNR